MKKLLLILLLATSASIIRAYDFQVGDLYYNILSDQNNAVEVTSSADDPQNQYNYPALASATIPSTVTYQGIEYNVISIGDYTFINCSTLTSISIPNSVLSIGKFAFADCNGLTSVIIPNSVTSIGGSAFNGCLSLSSVMIPNSVINIGSNPFIYCSHLASLVVDTGNPVYDSRENCNAIIETATNTLISGCQNTIIPNSVTCIDYAAFAYCLGMTSINIPNSVTSIGNNAFYYCLGLKSVTIPNSMTRMGEMVFAGCSALAAITCKSVTPPTLGSEAFLEVSKSIPLYVPENSITLYKGANQWKDFTNIQAISGGEDALDDITIAPDKVKYYENGQLLILRDGKTYTLQGQEVK